MKILLVVLLVLITSGCSSKSQKDIDQSSNEQKVDYINVICEDLEIEIMNYENGDTTKEDLLASIHLAQTDCNEEKAICATLNKNIKSNVSDKEILEYIKEIERSCNEY